MEYGIIRSIQDAGWRENFFMSDERLALLRDTVEGNFTVAFSKIEVQIKLGTRSPPHLLL